jgi:serine/threonine protein kinase
VNDRRSTEELSEFGFDAPGEPWLGELSQALTPPELGSIGEYEILGEVARGGQGVVYRARAAGTRRELALKRLVEGRLAAPATRRRFEREVEAAARLRHPGIVPVLGLDMVDGTPLLAMQWIDGVPVDEWARQCTGRDRFGRVVQLFLRVGDAVEHAHRLGVLHLDLKPSNVLVEPGDLPVVLDFGVARFTREDATASGSQDFLGTLAYASPEQVRGARSELDARSDVYSLGVLLYELLAGARPYAFGEGVGPALSLQERNQFPRLSAQVTGLSRTARRELDAIAGRALSAERSERYPTVAALCEDLRRLLEGRPVLAHPRSLSYELRKLARTHRAATVSAALFVLGTVAFAWYVEDRNRELERLRETEEQARTAAEESARAAQASALAADREAETRGQLLTFFFDELLRRALPTQPEADLTVRGLLELAAQRIEGHFSGRPEMEATMHAHLGMAFSNLGDLPSAEREFLRAIEGFADRPVDAARAQVSLANVRLGRGASSEEVLAMLEELEPFVAEFDLPTRYRYHSLRGQRLEFQRRLDEAADCFRQCCTIAIELDDEGQYGGALNDLGRCQAQAGRYTEARATYRQALRSFEAAGAGARDLLTSLQSDLSNLDQVEGYMVEAEELSRRSLEVVQELHGPLHPLVGPTPCSP